MVMPNNNPKDHYETAKVPWKKIREISKQYYEDKETLRKNNRNWCRGFSQEEKKLKSMVELKEYGKQYRKIMPEEDKQQKKEFMKEYLKD